MTNEYLGFLFCIVQKAKCSVLLHIFSVSHAEQFTSGIFQPTLRKNTDSLVNVSYETIFPALRLFVFVLYVFVGSKSGHSNRSDSGKNILQINKLVLVCLGLNLIPTNHLNM